jgi:hypothetical protein
MKSFMPAVSMKDNLLFTASERAAESMEAVVVSQAQGHAFTMERGRLDSLDGKLGMREGLTHRIVGESGGGQARAQLPATMGGVPTALPPGTTLNVG